MSINKIIEIKICVLLREHHDVIYAENDAAAHTPYLGLHRKLILTAILRTFSRTYLNVMYIQKIKNYKHFAKKIHKDPFA